jgi:fibronectin-binding autotransporter adhesin
MSTTVSAGVTSTGLTVGPATPLVVLSGGQAQFVTVLSGGSASLSSGAIGGFLTVSRGGVVSGIGELAGVSFDAGVIDDMYVGADALVEVLAGGAADYMGVTSSGTVVVEAGAAASGLLIQDGGLVEVLGSTTSAYVESGGQEVVFSRALATGDDIQSGGLLVLAGGTARGETVESGGGLDFGGALKTNLTDAPVVATTVLSGVTLSSGATLSLVGATVLSGATVSLATGTVAESLTVSKGGVLLGPGVLAGSSYAFGSVGAVTVGGPTEVDGNAGELTLLSGGTASGVTVRMLGGLQAESGGRLSQTEVESGGFEILSAGGIGAGDIVRSGGILFLGPGGSASGERVQSGGGLYFGGAVTSNFTLAAETVAATTVLSGVTISSGAGVIFYEASVLSGATLSLGATAGALGLTVSKGATLDGPGFLVGSSDVYGAISGATVSAGFVDLHSGGHAVGVTTLDGMGLYQSQGLQIDSGASATGSIASSGGLVGVLGSAIDTVVMSGGAEFVESTGVATGDLIQSGGVLYVLPGAVVSNETVLTSGALAFGGDLKSSFTLPSVSGLKTTVVLNGVTVSSGGMIEFTEATVLSGATLSLQSGAIAYDLTVSKGGVVVGPGPLQANNGIAGEVSGVTLEGSLALSAGAVASGVTVSFGIVDVAAGARAAGTVFAGSGFLDDLGSAAGTVLRIGAQIQVDSGGLASGDIISSGGLEVVLASGTASGTLVSNGGKRLISSGGLGVGAQVLSGGLAYVYTGGVDKGAVVSSRGEEVVAAGGAALDLSLIAGGKLVDEGEVRIGGAGTLAGTLSGSGALVQTETGDLVVDGLGTTFTGKAVIDAGTIELATHGALGTGSVQFVEPATGSAVLQIDAADAPAAGGTFANTLSNFNSAHEEIDLRSIAYVAGASATIVGSTLVLSDGGKTYLFNIAGATAGAYPVLSDGHGGTLIDPTALKPKTVAFAQAAAAFAPADAAKTALVSSASAAGHTPFAATASAGRP